jgi:hypothetical protein
MTGRGRSTTALSAVLASAAAETVPITTMPGTLDRARQDSSAAQISAAAAVATGLPRSVITKAATSNPADRCATTQDVVAVSSSGTHPGRWIASMSPVRTVSSPATRSAAATCRCPDSTWAPRKKAATMSTVINVDAVAGPAIASQILSRMAPLTSDMRTA